MLPMVEHSEPVRQPHTLITADAGYHTNDNLAALCERGIPALIADRQMRQRDARFDNRTKHMAKPDPLHDKRASGQEQAIRLHRPHDFLHDRDSNNCICPAGQRLYSNGSHCRVNGRVYHKFTGSLAACMPCAQRERCLRHPQRTEVRQVAVDTDVLAAGVRPLMVRRSLSFVIRRSEAVVREGRARSVSRVSRIHARAGPSLVVASLLGERRLVLGGAGVPESGRLPAVGFGQVFPSHVGLRATASSVWRRPGARAGWCVAIREAHYTCARQSFQVTAP